jgi:hypothetical protein
MTRRLRIVCIAAVLVSLGLRTYDLIFVKFSAKETVHAVLLLVVVCSLFPSLRRDIPPKKIPGKE